jgi:two-component system, NarL family, nitrate/nitrite response regulator NarL
MIRLFDADSLFDWFRTTERLPQAAPAPYAADYCAREYTMKQERRLKKAEVLIADKEAVFRMGLRRLFSADEGLRVLAEAENGVQAVHLVRQHKPGLIFLQSGLLPGNIEKLLARLRSASPGCRIVITAGSLGNGEHLRYIKAGASGVILKSDPPALFVKCVHKVMEGEVWLPKKEVAQMAQMLESAPLAIPRPIETLTQREKIVISYVIQGWRNREIAEHLEISEQTVKNHLRAVYDKVGVSDRLELALYVINQRVELPSPASVVASQA